MYCSCAQSLASNFNFDIEHYPQAIEIKMLTQNDWNKPDQEQPRWVGFAHEKKAFKLEELQDADRGFGNEIDLLHTLILPGALGKLSKVEFVINPYLHRAFELKKLQSGLKPLIVYHATKPENVNSIIENNFNWRLSGRSSGFLYGKGVCFSEMEFSTHQYCHCSEKRIIVTLILYGRSCIGHNGAILPKNGYDTTKSPDDFVLVKFEDSEFLPLEIQHYTQ